MLGRVRLNGEDADGPSLRDEWYAEPGRLLGRNAESLDLARGEQLGVPLVRHELRLAGPQDIAGRPPRVLALEWEPPVRIGEVVLLFVLDVRPADQLALFVPERDEEIPREHELPHDLVGRAVELLHVLRRARKLGNAVQGVLHPGRIVGGPHRLKYPALRNTRLGSRR